MLPSALPSSPVCHQAASPTVLHPRGEHCTPYLNLCTTVRTSTRSRSHGHGTALPCSSSPLPTAASPRHSGLICRELRQVGGGDSLRARGGRPGGFGLASPSAGFGSGWRRRPPRPALASAAAVAGAGGPRRRHRRRAALLLSEGLELDHGEARRARLGPGDGASPRFASSSWIADAIASIWGSRRTSTLTGAGSATPSSPSSRRTDPRFCTERGSLLPAAAAARALAPPPAERAAEDEDDGNGRQCAYWRPSAPAAAAMRAWAADHLLGDGGRALLDERDAKEVLGLSGAAIASSFCLAASAGPPCAKRASTVTSTLAAVTMTTSDERGTWR